MQWNPLVPEISVSDLARSLRFSAEGVGFAIAFTRTDPGFASLGVADVRAARDRLAGLGATA